MFCSTPGRNWRNRKSRGVERGRGSPGRVAQWPASARSACSASCARGRLRIGPACSCARSPGFRRRRRVAVRGVLRRHGGGPARRRCGGAPVRAGPNVLRLGALLAGVGMALAIAIPGPGRPGSGWSGWLSGQHGARAVLGGGPRRSGGQHWRRRGRDARLRRHAAGAAADRWLLADWAGLRLALLVLVAAMAAIGVGAAALGGG